MLRNIQCSVLNKGLSRNYFTLLRGVRQGCPLFPFFFVLEVELLVDKTRRSREQKFFKRNLKWVNLLMTSRFLTAISDLRLSWSPQLLQNSTFRKPLSRTLILLLSNLFRERKKIKSSVEQRSLIMARAACPHQVKIPWHNLCRWHRSLDFY